MGTGQYDGPYRHFHVSVSETAGGMLISQHEFEIVKGRRRFKRTYPPILLGRTDVRPASIRALLRLVAEELRP